MDIRRQFRNEIEITAATARRMGELGYVASHGGNVSYRVSDEVVLITPTKVVKRLMQPDDICAIDMSGAAVSAPGGRRPTGEVPMHLMIYRLRPDLNGIVHAHAPYLTGFSMVDSDILENALLPETTLEIGPLVKVPYAEPISENLARRFEEKIHLTNAWLMQNHGVTIASSEGVDRALEFLEMAEALAHSVAIASTLGTVTTIPRHEVENMERTLATRSMPRPGDPRHITSLVDLYRL